MNTPGSYFKHSGSVGGLGLPLIIVVGLVAAVVLSFVYAFAIFYIPFVYINFFITIGFGLLLGSAIGHAGKKGDVRNPTLMTLFGLIFACIGLYLSWIAWIYAASGRELLVLFPGDVITVVSEIAKEGMWGIFGWTPTGFALWAIWLIEAIIIVGGTALFAAAVVSGTPYCERCSRWIDDTSKLEELQAIEDPDGFRSQLEAGDFSALAAISDCEASDAVQSEVELMHCPSCDGLHLVTVNSVTIETDSKGKTSRNDSSILQNLVVPSDVFSQLSARFVEKGSPVAE